MQKRVENDNRSIECGRGWHRNMRFHGWWVVFYRGEFSFEIDQYFTFQPAVVEQMFNSEFFFQAIAD